MRGQTPEERAHTGWGEGAYAGAPLRVRPFLLYRSCAPQHKENGPGHFRPGPFCGNRYFFSRANPCTASGWCASSASAF